MRKSTKITAVLGGVALTVATAGAAYAYWTTSGSGNGSAATGTVVGITVNQTNTVADLYPGGPPQPLSGDFDNSNAGSVYVASVSAVLGTLPAGCVAADFTIAGTAPVNALVPSGSAQGSWSGLTIKMNDTGVSQNTCKSSTIPLTLSSN
jgi:hypothetical protein